MNQDVEALILAGGKGTRLASVVIDVPKPMAPINDNPFLLHLINSIKEQNIKNIRLLVGYKVQVVKEYFGDGSSLGVSITYTEEDAPLGTGGAIKKAIEESSFDKFIVFNGDSLFEADLSLLLKFSKRKFSIALKYLQDCQRYGQVAIDERYNIKSFIEKGSNDSDGFINAGIYCFSREIIDFFPAQDSFSLEQVIFPKLVELNLIMGVPLVHKDIRFPEEVYNPPKKWTVVKEIGNKPDNIVIYYVP